MVNDLFTKPKTASDKFWEWCKQKKLFSSIDISRYGLANYYLRANRTCREWCEGDNPRLRRLDDKEKLFRGLWNGQSANVGFYEVIL